MIQTIIALLIGAAMTSTMMWLVVRDTAYGTARRHDRLDARDARRAARRARTMH